MAEQREENEEEFYFRSTDEINEKLLSELVPKLKGFAQWLIENDKKLSHNPTPENKDKPGGDLPGTSDNSPLRDG